MRVNDIRVVHSYPQGRDRSVMQTQQPRLHDRVKQNLLERPHAGQ
jgi:hypothetical protein